MALVPWEAAGIRLHIKGLPWVLSEPHLPPLRIPFTHLKLLRPTLLGPAPCLRGILFSDYQRHGSSQQTHPLTLGCQNPLRSPQKPNSSDSTLLSLSPLTHLSQGLPCLTEGTEPMCPLFTPNLGFQHTEPSTPDRWNPHRQPCPKIPVYRVV